MDEALERRIAEKRRRRKREQREKPLEAYRTEDAHWKLSKSDVPMDLPSFCVTQ